MDAHMGKGLQLQVHCCCCTAILRSTSRWTHICPRDFSFRSIAVVPQPYMCAHPHGRTYGQGTSASGPLLLFHSHTCVHIDMDAQKAKHISFRSIAVVAQPYICAHTLQVQVHCVVAHPYICAHTLQLHVHCCCCTAIHMCTYKGSSTWMLCTAIHVCTSISGSGPWMLLYSHTYVHIHFRSICCCTYIAYICTPTMHAQVHCCCCTSMLYLCVHTFHVHAHGCSSP